MTIIVGATIGGLAIAAPARAAEPIGDYQYADHWRNTLNVYVPTDRPGPYPLVVYIHGGGWLSGDNSAANLYADALLSRGIAVAGINYRYSYHDPFPAQLHDCKGAIRWLRAHADEFDLDVNKFGVFGESAGGHLASLVALTIGDATLEGNVGGNTSFSSGVTCLVDVYGPSDLFALVADGGTMAAESQLIGHSVPDIYQNIGNPSYASLVSLVRSASPTWHVSANDPPALILHGTNDDVIPFSQSQLLYDAMLDRGVTVAFQSMPGVGHELPVGYEQQVFDFLQQHLGGSEGGGSDGILDVLGGSSSGDAFGSSIAVIDDVNGDGIDDILVGAPFNDERGNSAGRATLYSGANDTVLRTLYGRSVGDQFGFSVASAGDVNGDGRGDFIIGAPAFNGSGVDSGRVYLYSGRNGAVLRMWNGRAAGDRFGRAVAGPGDVDGDGKPDVLIGAPFADPNGSASGSAYLYSGATGSKLVQLNGHRTNDRFGQAVGGAGDRNQDGRAEIIVASPYFDPSSTRTNAGRIMVYGKTGNQWATQLILYGQTAGENFGYAVNGPGDLNGDGVDDLAIGAPGHDGDAVNNGLVRLYSGTNGQLIRSIAPPSVQADQGFGASIAALADVNGDGRSDLAIGCLRFSTNGQDVGRVVVMADAGATVVKAVLGTLADSQFGFCVVSGGDRDGDGVSDLLVGSPSMRINGTNAGACILYSTQELP